MRSIPIIVIALALGACATSNPNVVPVYQAAQTLADVVSELEPYTEEFDTTDGHRAVVAEVLLVHDSGPDDSPTVMRELAQKYAWVRTLWLSRNYGQHAATLAGMASSGGEPALAPSFCARSNSQSSALPSTRESVFCR